MNFFVGAGFPILARSNHGGALPLGEALKIELCRNFLRPDLESLSLPRTYDVLSRHHPQEVVQFLNSRLDVAEYDPRYDAISSLPFTSIITTNIDNLVHRIYSHHSIKYVNDMVIGGSSFKTTDAVDYIPLHGCITHGDGNFTFGAMDLASAFARDPDRFHFLTERLQKLPTLFWGYAMEDAGALQSLDRRTIQNREHQQKWIQLRNPTPPEFEYFSELGFSLIISETDELLVYLNTVVGSVARATHSSIYKFERVPQLADVKSRPLPDFYLGAPPVWHDVLTNRIPRLAAFRNCEDLINGDQHVFITGIPQSGKTTLLMQRVRERQWREAGARSCGCRQG